MKVEKGTNSNLSKQMESLLLEKEKLAKKVEEQTAKIEGLFVMK